MASNAQMTGMQGVYLVAAELSGRGSKERQLATDFCTKQTLPSRPASDHGWGDDELLENRGGVADLGRRVAICGVRR